MISYIRFASIQCSGNFFKFHLCPVTSMCLLNLFVISTSVVAIVKENLDTGANEILVELQQKSEF